ncbi:hypothetical protein [Conexibacter woesei]|uniref:hypothetical protein n=1 Tax=Conexibacter woesei TaxID=191495 RepID=UPI0012DD2525|nr:hypothetical protein [Conexibacter woesei]
MTRRRRPLALLLALGALVVLGLVATSALASRAATDQEAAAVAAAAHSDVQCVTVRISTKDESYAELYSAQNPDCTDADGAAVFHNAGGVWKSVYENSGQEGCPRELPQAVAIDFKICSAPSRKVYVARDGRLVYKPKTLPNGAHSGFIGMRWTGWNTATAVGRGTMDYQDAYEKFQVKVRVTLTSRKVCGSKRTYQHMHVTLLGGTASQRKIFGGNFNRLGCGYDE